MSVDISVFTYKDKLPTFNDLQKAVNKVNNKLTLEEFSLKDHTGFLPCEYDGEECGFEYYIDEVDDELIEEWELDVEELSGRDICITFATRSNFVDLISSALTSSVLCHVADGITFDDNNELTINSANSLEFGNNIVLDAKREIEEEKAKEKLFKTLDSDEKIQNYFDNILESLSNTPIKDVKAIFGFSMLGLVCSNDTIISCKNWEFIDKENVISSNALPEDYSELLQYVGETIDKCTISNIVCNDKNQLIISFDHDIQFNAYNTIGTFGINDTWKVINKGVEFSFKDEKLQCL